MGCFKPSKRSVALFLEQVLDQACSAGWVVKRQQRATAALTPVNQALANQRPTEPVLSIDESPTKQARLKSWLWTFVTRAAMLRRMRPIRREIDRLLVCGVFRGHPKLVGRCEPLDDERDWLGTFLEVEGVEPTNHVRERALRPPRDLAKTVRRHQKRPRQPLRGNDPDCRRDLPPTIPH
jgi:hypothetical protein